MFATLLFLNPVQASTIEVGPSGDFTTITDAIAASMDGDRIEVSAGTYDESIDFLGKSITVTGLAGPLSTTITGDGEQTVRMISDEDGEAVLEGFTIQGSGHTCIWLEDSSPKLENLIVQDCGDVGDSEGGGARVHSGRPHFSSVQFIGNVGEIGGGIWAGDEADVTLNNCSFTGNTGGSGGAISCQESNLTVTGTDFISNEALEANGGAISSADCSIDVTAGTMDENVAFSSGGALFASGGSISLSSISSISRNTATYGYGGGIALGGSDGVVISGVTLSENQAWDGGGGIRLANALTTFITDTQFDGNQTLHVDANGGAIEALSGDLSFENCWFSNNVSGGYGGATFASGSDVSGDELLMEHNSTLGEGGGLALSLGNLVLTNSLLERNDGLSGGGGIFLTQSDASVTDSILEWNGSDGGHGGAIKISDSDVTLSRLHLAGNSARYGGGLYSEDTGTFDWSDSVIQENEALFGSGGARIEGNGSTSIRNNSFIGNETHTSDSNAQLLVDTDEIDIRNNLIAWGVNGSGLELNPLTVVAPVVRHNDVWSNETANYQGVVDPTGTTGNISLDPLLVDVSFDLDFENDDLYLLHDSPCLGSGDPDLADMEGRAGDIGARGLTDIPALDEDGDGYPPESGGDCNDYDPTINPSATELCGDDVDNNCDGAIDEGCGEDTGPVEPDEPEDTGDPPPSEPDPSEEDRTGGNDAQPSAEDKAYGIEGQGCHCSANSTDPAWVWLSLLPMIISRRRRT